MPTMTEMATVLADKREGKLLRQLTEYSPLSSSQVAVDGRNYLLLASNNYLGLTHHPKVKAAAVEAVQRYGTGSGGARLTSGNHPLYSKLEQQLATFKQREAALVFNTGYMTNVGTISAIAGHNDVLFSDELNHASIIDGCRLSKARTAVYRHSDMSHLAQLLQTTPCSGQRLIVTDGVFSMDGDIACLAEIVELAEQYDSLVMVDDAHATGVIGSGGHGTATHCGVSGRVHIEVGTLSKSLAAEGGFVAGTQLLIDYLMNKARSFIFSTALSPATLAAAGAALQQLREHPELVATLALRAKLLKQQLLDGGVLLTPSDTPIIPVLVGDADKAVQVAAKLYEAGLIVSAIRPPTVGLGRSRLRITVTAAHKVAELEQAGQTIIAVCRQLGIGLSD
jgi:8-amino-7-oxononanoate synthase